MYIWLLDDFSVSVIVDQCKDDIWKMSIRVSISIFQYKIFLAEMKVSLICLNLVGDCLNLKLYKHLYWKRPWGRL